MIEAYITNLGKYTEGELKGEYLKFPATTEEVQALLSKIGVDGVMYEEYFITDYSTNLAGMQNLGEYASIDELNYLVTLLSDMDEWELEKFEAAAVYGEYSGDTQDLINLAQNLDCYEYYPEVKSYEELGQYLIHELDFEQIPEHLTDYFDYESYAEAYVINEGGQFLESGFVFRNSCEFEKHYNGRADLPDEHKIFAYPPPEKSIQKALSNYKEMITDTAKAITGRQLETPSRPANAER